MNRRDAGVRSRGSSRHARQAGRARFALDGLRLQAEGLSPGPIEATGNITDEHGHLVGHLGLEDRDAQ
jgi:hypothetical protein